MDEYGILLIMIVTIGWIVSEAFKTDKKPFAGVNGQPQNLNATGGNLARQVGVTQPQFIFIPYPVTGVTGDACHPVTPNGYAQSPPFRHPVTAIQSPVTNGNPMNGHSFQNTIPMTPGPGQGNGVYVFVPQPGFDPNQGGKNG